MYVCVCTSYLPTRPLGSSRSVIQAQRGVGFIPVYTHQHKTCINAHIKYVNYPSSETYKLIQTDKNPRHVLKFLKRLISCTVCADEKGATLPHTALKTITDTHKQTHTAEQLQRLRPSDQSILILSSADNGIGSRRCAGRVIIVFSYTTYYLPLGSLLQHTLVYVFVRMYGIILFVLGQYGC